MGWLRDLIFGEPDDDDEYLARLNNNDMVSPQDNRGSRDENNFDKDTSGVAADTRKSDSKPQPDQYHSANGQKVIPEIEVERTEAHPSGDNKYLEVWAHIRNHASFDVELDKYEILGHFSSQARFLSCVCIAGRCRRAIRCVKCIFSTRLLVRATIFRLIT